MKFLTRILLFSLTNILVLAVLSVVLFVGSRYLGIQLDGQGYGGLLLISAVYGFGGSMVSLLMSKMIAKWTTGAKVIESPRSETEVWLLNTVRDHAQRVGIGMPEVAIYPSGDMNAFATGWSRNSALVAVSSGLLQSMRREEVDAVLGHEISHVANGDMVTLSLLQGVLNTFVFFASRVIGSIVDSALSRGEDRERSRGGMGYFLTVMVLQIVFGFMASMVVAWFSRRREFRADEGGALLAGKNSMIAALRRLSGMGSAPTDLPKSMTAFGIRGGLLGLFASHPPIEERIAALQAQTVQAA